MVKKNTFSAIAGVYLLQNHTGFQNGIPTIVPNWGTSISAMISYSASGYVIATLRSSDPTLLPLTNLTYPPNANQSDHDWNLIGRATLTYAGPYTVHTINKTHGWVEHGPLIHTHVPTQRGGVLVRNYSMVKENGESLVRLSFPTGATGESVLWWKKLD